MDLELSNIINISVSEAGPGVGEYNTSNVALFSHEPFAESFGDNGFAIYKSPSQVAVDFGTASETYAQALAIFSQNPNILANDGYLVVIPFVEAIQHLAFSGTAASGSFVINFDGDATAAIAWDDTATEIQDKIIAGIPSLVGAVVTGSIAAGLNIALNGVYGNAPLITITSNTLMTITPTAITILVTTTQTGETLAAAITRTTPLVQYFAIIGSLIFIEADVLAAAAVVQALNKILVIVSRTEADIDPGGMIDLLRTGTLTKTRGLYYGGADDESALGFLAAYAGRGFSTNFDGSNTTQNMHLKSLSGVQPDPTMTQTILEKAQDAGADIYASFQGVPKTFCSGANKFFDQVYNLGWFVGALQVAGFNLLAQVGTKIVQTENGMNQLKNAYRQVCDQGVTNQYFAPGSWTSPNTFGNLENFFANIIQKGYYIFSGAISQQSPAARAARQAPLVQIAAKEAGAIDSSTVIVNINA